MAPEFTYERIMIVGAPGTGKSYTLRRLLDERADARDRAGLRTRIVLFDPMNEYNLRGATRVETRAQFLRAVELERWPIVVAAVFEDWSPLHEYTDLLLAADEMHNYATAHRIHESQRKLFCESRKRRCDLIVATQRVNHLNPVVISTQTRTYILPLKHREDRKAIETGLSITLPPVSGWRPVPGASNPLARLPLVSPDDFDADTGCVRAAPR